MAHYIFTKPRRFKHLSFDGRDSIFDDDITSNWQAKAERLQERRWRRLKQQLV
ncbi:MAG: hypothetical protein ABI221_00425 [Candidatus Saccharimonadales bacterium]